jgi:putative endonuclease
MVFRRRPTRPAAPRGERAPATPAAPHRGAEFESLAAARLARAGCVVLARNYRCRGGEIDLVVLDRATVAFVEVRYRRSSTHGGAAASIDARKRARLVRAAGHFLLMHPGHAERPCRFDVVAIDGDGAAREVTWIVSAFSA